MHSVTLNDDNRDDVAARLADGWTVACLCAGWCGTCTGYRIAFEELAARHPDKFFLWIDIEDQAGVVGDLDIDNFPTLLLQKDDVIAFFGTVLPDPGLAHRLVLAKSGLAPQELIELASSSEEKRGWQREANLSRLLRDAA